MLKGFVGLGFCSPASHEDVAVREDIDLNDDSDDLTLPRAELKLSRRWAIERNGHVHGQLPTVVLELSYPSSSVSGCEPSAGGGRTWIMRATAPSQMKKMMAQTQR